MVRSTPITSRSLLLRIRDSEDNESWALFESLYTPLIRAYCRRRGFQSVDIDDIAQEVMTTVLKKISDYEYDSGKGKFRSWLATVTANHLKASKRKHAIQQKHLLAAIESFCRSPSDDSEWNQLFTQTVFDSACLRIREHFNETTWRCFQLTWLKHKSPVSVADELSIPVHSVYVNKSRVLKRLEEEFQFLAEDLL